MVEWQVVFRSYWDTSLQRSCKLVSLIPQTLRKSILICETLSLLLIVTTKAPSKCIVVPWITNFSRISYSAAFWIHIFHLGLSIFKSLDWIVTTPSRWSCTNSPIFRNSSIWHCCSGRPRSIFSYRVHSLNPLAAWRSVFGASESLVVAAKTRGETASRATSMLSPKSPESYLSSRRVDDNGDRVRHWILG
jgi:hypothetical protein